MKLLRFTEVRSSESGNKRCIICGNNQHADSDASFHRIPDDPIHTAAWLSIFNIKEEDIIKALMFTVDIFSEGETPDITLGCS